MRSLPNALAASAALALILALPGLSLAAKHKTASTQPANHKTASSQPAQPEPVIEEQAAQVLANACKALTGLTGFSFHAEVALDKVYQDGSKVEYDRDMDVMVQRPGAFRIVTVGDDFQATSVFDGKTFTISLPDKRVYGQIPAAMDTDALMNLLAAQYGIESPLGDLIANDPCGKLKPQAGFYVGKGMVGKTACDHLFFRGAEVDWQLWVEDGPTKLPRKIVITEKKLPQSPQFTAVLSDWKSVGPASDAFVFAPLDGSTRDDGVITGRIAGKRGAP